LQKCYCWKYRYKICCPCEILDIGFIEIQHPAFFLMLHIDDNTGFGGWWTQGMWRFCGPSSVAFIKRLVFERVPINLLHGFRYARHSLLRQQKKVSNYIFWAWMVIQCSFWGCLVSLGGGFFLAAGSSKESHQTDAVLSNKMRQGEIFIQVWMGDRDCTFSGVILMCRKIHGFSNRALIKYK